jgi:hypothetical protein
LPDESNRPAGLYPIDRWKQESDNMTLFVARQQRVGHP